MIHPNTWPIHCRAIEKDLRTAEAKGSWAAVKYDNAELRRLLRVLWLAFPMSLEPKLSPEDKAAIREVVGEE